jgi:hypothetical protein
LEALQQVKLDKESITQSLQSLQDRYRELSQEKELTAGQLEERNRIAKQLEEEKEKLEIQTQSLTATLEVSFAFYFLCTASRPVPMLSCNVLYLQTVESAKEKLAEERRMAEELLLRESKERVKIEEEKKRQSMIVQEKEELIKLVEQEKKEKEKAYLVVLHEHV